MVNSCSYLAHLVDKAAHTRERRGSGFEKDCEKYAEALIAGWSVLRVTGAMVEDGRAINYLTQILEMKGL